MHGRVPVPTPDYPFLDSLSTSWVNKPMSSEKPPEKGCWFSKQAHFTASPPFHPRLYPRPNRRGTAMANPYHLDRRCRRTEECDDGDGDD
jgi:hypothetical protein